ncbi:MAG: hypothetical protein ACNYPE_03730 [Candidatus Azotimanducaceae bacterium WSBS_2022_MAG_OTU7]
MAKKNARSGSTLEDMFREEGNYEAIKNAAIKSVLAYKLEEAMKDQNLSKTSMAKKWPLAARKLIASLIQRMTVSLLILCKKQHRLWVCALSWSCITPDNFSRFSYPPLYR